MQIATGHPYQQGFDEMEPGQPLPGGLDARVICSANIPPRAGVFEYHLERGRDVVEALFAERAPRVVLATSAQTLFLCFPERHCSVHEQRYLLDAIDRADRPHLRRVDVLTSSPFIVQSASCVSVVQDTERYLFDPDAEQWWFTA